MNSKSTCDYKTAELVGNNNSLHHENSSSVIIANNVDLLMQILLHLPVKSLLVSKSVSKRWFSLISDPIFIEKHFLENPHSIPGLFMHNLLSGPYIPELEFVSLDASASSPFNTLDFIEDPLGVQINQSCNGLLCCRSYRGTFVDHTYYICNPSTRQYRAIFCGSRGEKQGFVSLCSVSLAFDVLKSPHYKVVCIWLLKKTTNTGDVKFYHQIELYSSETASWKLSGNVFPAPRDVFYKVGEFWNGSLHWLDLSKEGKSVCFSVEQELIMEMPKPPRSDGMFCIYFAECRGHLHLIQTHESRTSFEILEMMDDYKGWDVKYRVNIDDLTNAYPNITKDATLQFHYLQFSVLLVEVKERKSSTNLNRVQGKVSLNLVIQVLDEVISYDLEEMGIKKIDKLSPTTNLHRRNSPFQYIETLTCI